MDNMMLMVDGSNDPLPAPIVATTAVAGNPGHYLPIGAEQPANGAAIEALAAQPTSAWTTGQRVVAANNDERSWTGTAWQIGPVQDPPPPPEEDGEEQ